MVIRKGEGREIELQTVRQVSKNYGISARMLRYYEQAGLLESCRIDGYSYRAYDETAVRRLRQIIVLRKLRIPIKQICIVLNNNDAAAVIDVFERNINELDEKITALATVRSILERFINELRDKANVQMQLDWLGDNAALGIVGGLPFTKQFDRI